MATKLFLRNTTTNGITDTGDGVVYDMLPAAGAAVDTDTVTLTDGGTEIQWTQSAGGSTIAWISGRVPAGGFTLTTTDISVWLLESNMNDEAEGRFRVFKYSPGPTITELGGGPFDDGAELGTAITEMTWIGNVTDTAFAENDRILVRLYATNFTTMTAGTADLKFNAANAATGDSFFNIAETVTFKGETTTVSAPVTTHTYTALAPKVNAQVKPAQVTHTYTAQVPVVKNLIRIEPAAVTHTYTAQAPQVKASVIPGLVTHTYTAQVPSLKHSITPSQASHSYEAQTPQVKARVMPAAVTHTYTAQTPQVRARVQPGVVNHTYTPQTPTLKHSLLPGAVTHNYAAQSPQVKASVQPGTVTHTYTAVSPKVNARVAAPVVTHVYTGQAPSVLEGAASLGGSGSLMLVDVGKMMNP